MGKLFACVVNRTTQVTIGLLIANGFITWRLQSGTKHYSGCFVFFCRGIFKCVYQMIFFCDLGFTFPGGFCKPTSFTGGVLYLKHIIISFALNNIQMKTS